MTRFEKRLLIVGLTLALLAVGAVAAGRYTWAAGRLRDRRAAVLDVRGEALTAQEAMELKERMPECYVVWDIPLSGGSASSAAKSVTVSGLTQEDLALLELFDSLQTLDVSGCDDYESLLDFRSQHPDCTLRFTVALGASEYPEDSAAITLEDASAEQLMGALKYLPDLRELTLTGRIPEAESLAALAQAYPGVDFRFRVAGVTIQTGATEVDLGDAELPPETVETIAAMLPHLEKMVMGSSAMETADLAALGVAFPGVVFLQEVTIGGKNYSTDLTELDISGTQITAAEVEALLPCFGNLERVIMCGCGVDDETMDGMNRRYDDIRFVWSVKIKDVTIRTDAKWFYPFKYYRDMIVEEEDLYPMRYLTDLEAIDIGHMTQVRTCEWVRYMPNLKYLILAETAITDISPLAELKNLVFLEIFTTHITDYSPLLKCTALEDLNLGNTYGDPEPISHMTWLKHLWWSGTMGASASAPYILPEALPDTEMKFNLNTPNVQNGWRQLDNYYAMRDLMDVFYLS